MNSFARAWLSIRLFSVRWRVCLEYSGFFNSSIQTKQTNQNEINALEEISSIQFVVYHSTICSRPNFQSRRGNPFPEAAEARTSQQRGKPTRLPQSRSGRHCDFGSRSGSLSLTIYTRDLDITSDIFTRTITETI